MKHHKDLLASDGLKSSKPTHASRPADNLEHVVLFVVLAVLVQPIINACATFLNSYSVIQITWARYAGHFVFMLLIFAPRSGLDLLRMTRLPLQLTRSSLHCLPAILTFYALGFVALPTATEISFSAPPMVTALAPLVLGERVGFIRWLAVAAGFIDALVVCPGASGQDWAVALLLANAAASAVIQLMSRKLAQHDEAVISNTYMVLVGIGSLTSSPALKGGDFQGEGSRCHLSR